MTLRDFAADLLRRADLPNDEPLILSAEVCAWPDGTLDALMDAGLLAPAASATRVSCQECDETHSERVQYSEFNDQPFIMCPTQGRVWLDPPELQLWRITLLSFAERVCQALSNGFAPESRKPGRHWYLGVLPGDEGRQLHLVRGINWIDGHDTFASLLGSPRNLVLSLDSSQPTWLPAAQFASLSSLLKEEEAGLEISPVGLRVVTTQLEKPYQLHREGNQWRLCWQGAEARLPHSLGLTYIAHLVRNPYQEIPALRLMAITGGHEQSFEFGRIGQVNTEEYRIDVVARNSYQSRIAELDAKKRTSGLGSEEQVELDVLQKELRSSSGLGKHPRRIAGRGEKARSSVTHAITRALSKVAIKQPVAAEHLRRSIARGGMLCYRPPEPRDWDVQLS